MREAYLAKDVLLLFLGIFCDIFGIAPDHDEHNRCFIDKPDDDWPHDEGKEEH